MGWWVAGWLLFGALSFLLFPKDHPITWFELLILMPICALFGPTFLVIVVLVMLFMASFWDEPVFKRKNVDMPDA